MVAGPTGIGRTTMLATLRERLERRGRPVLSLRLTPAERKIPDRLRVAGLARVLPIPRLSRDEVAGLLADQVGAVPTRPSGRLLARTGHHSRVDLVAAIRNDTSPSH